MATWYSIELEQGDTANNMMRRVMDAFMPKYIGAGRPLAMAIFSSHNQESNLVTLYFAPKALSLAMQFGASPCDDSFADMDLSLLVGDEQSIGILFPDATEQ